MNLNDKLPTFFRKQPEAGGQAIFICCGRYDKHVLSRQTTSGLETIPNRVDDVAGLAVSCTKFGRDFRRVSGPDGAAANETTLELTCKAQVTRWLALQADAQFLFHPAVNANSGLRETATILGLRAVINF